MVPNAPNSTTLAANKLTPRVLTETSALGKVFSLIGGQRHGDRRHEDQRYGGQRQRRTKRKWLEMRGIIAFSSAERGGAKEEGVLNGVGK